MGKHTASDEAVVHPLVADALERRHQTEDPRVHRSSELGAPNIVATQSAAPQSAAVGWPTPPGRGEGLGWPGDLHPEPAGDTHPDDDGSVLAALEEAADPAPAAVEEQTPVRRSGWRRFFGGGHSSTARNTSAA